MSASGLSALRVVRWAARILGGLGAVLLFAMMVLTFADVWGRYFFGAPIAGAFEVTELLLATLIFAGLPVITANGDHVTVDLFERLVRGRLAVLRDALIDLAAAGMSGILAARLWQKADDALSFGDTTSVLGLPMAPLVYFMSAACLLSAGIFVLHAWLRAQGTSPTPPERT